MDIDLQLLNGGLDILVLILLGAFLLRPKKKPDNNPNLDEVKQLIHAATSASQDLNIELNTQQRELKDLLLNIEKKKLELTELIATAAVPRHAVINKKEKKPSSAENYFSSYDPVFEYMLDKPKLPTFQDVLPQGHKLDRLAREQTSHIQETRDDPSSRLITKVEVMRERRSVDEDIPSLDDGDHNDPRLGVLAKR